MKVKILGKITRRKFSLTYKIIIKKVNHYINLTLDVKKFSRKVKTDKN